MGKPRSFVFLFVILSVPVFRTEGPYPRFPRTPLSHRPFWRVCVREGRNEGPVRFIENDGREGKPKLSGSGRRIIKVVRNSGGEEENGSVRHRSGVFSREEGSKGQERGRDRAIYTQRACSPYTGAKAVGLRQRGLSSKTASGYCVISLIIQLDAARRAMTAASLLPKQQWWLFYVFPFPVPDQNLYDPDRREGESK